MERRTNHSERHHCLGPLFLALHLAVALALFPALPGNAQNGNPPLHPGIPRTLSQAASDDVSDASNGSSPENEKMLRAMNAVRQKSLVADTNKLLRLANELNAEIAGAQPGSLTPGQLHRIAEIEKLAHSVREKMSTSVRGIPPNDFPIGPVHN